MALYPSKTPRFVFALSIGGVVSCSFCPALGALIYHFLGFQGPAYFMARLQVVMGVVLQIFVKVEDVGTETDELLKIGTKDPEIGRSTNEIFLMMLCSFPSLTFSVVT